MATDIDSNGSKGMLGRCKKRYLAIGALAIAVTMIATVNSPIRHFLPVDKANILLKPWNGYGIPRLYKGTVPPQHGDDPGQGEFKHYDTDNYVDVAHPPYHSKDQVIQATKVQGAMKPASQVQWWQDRAQELKQMKEPTEQQTVPPYALVKNEENVPNQFEMRVQQPMPYFVNGDRQSQNPQAYAPVNSLQESNPFKQPLFDTKVKPEQNDNPYLNQPLYDMDPNQHRQLQGPHNVPAYIPVNHISDANDNPYLHQPNQEKPDNPYLHQPLNDMNQEKPDNPYLNQPLFDVDQSQELTGRPRGQMSGTTIKWMQHLKDQYHQFVNDKEATIHGDVGKQAHLGLTDQLYNTPAQHEPENQQESGSDISHYDDAIVDQNTEQRQEYNMAQSGNNLQTPQIQQQLGQQQYHAHSPQLNAVNQQDAIPEQGVFQPVLAPVIKADQNEQSALGQYEPHTAGVPVNIFSQRLQAGDQFRGNQDMPVNQNAVIAGVDVTEPAPYKGQGEYQYIKGEYVKVPQTNTSSQTKESELLVAINQTQNNASSSSKLSSSISNQTDSFQDVKNATERRYQFPFQDPGLSTEERVEDLVGRLTVAELVSQGTATYKHPTPGIERLGIRPFNWITECLHGEMNTKSTAFPQAIGLAASFSRDLMYNVSDAISKEVRAQWNDLQKANQSHVFYGITCFSPTINILRHPLWGRNQETYGEDPFLTGELAAMYVKGLQGTDQQRMRVAAGCKHFAAHSGPENGRFSFNAKVPEYDLHMTYYPAFRACVEAGSAGLMCSYNRVNGVPACANRVMLTELARQDWGFQGYIVSDSTAIENIFKYHRYNNSALTSVAEAVNAGCNLELTWFSSMFTMLPQAVQQGLVSEDTLRHSVKTLFRTRMLLGEFDLPEMNIYGNLSQEIVQSPAHQELAKQAAKMSFVLLKNNNFLPITQKYKKIAVIGPYATASSDLYGAYAPRVNHDVVSTPYDAMKSLADQVVLVHGCREPSCDSYSEDSLSSISDSELFIVCLGTGSEREGGDRKSLSLPGKQMDLLKLVASQAKGQPVVVLLFNGSPVDIGWAVEDSSITAILECWYPAQAAGTAIVDTLTAKDVHSIPSARLPMTWPISLEQVPDISNYSMHERTYRYFTGEALFPFGYGLSYTTFQYSGLSLDKDLITPEQNLVVSVNVSNTGSFDAYEVVQLYLCWDEETRAIHPGIPVRKLVGFTRTLVKADNVQLVRFVLTAQQRAVFITHSGLNRFQVLPGIYTLYVGGQQPYQKASLPSNVLQTMFKIVSTG